MDKRVILIIADSVGIGALPDAEDFGDSGSDTLGHIYSVVPDFSLPNLERLGLRHINGISFPSDEGEPIGGYGKMKEISVGKDTTTGHWELSGLTLAKPFRLFPNGFDDEIIEQFTAATGYQILCNKPASGTEIIKQLGEEHMKTKKLIVYTSGDSVFQIAAHESIVPIEELYDVCRKARKILDNYDVSRVIARPFVGDSADTFVRTPNRRDFSVAPTGETILHVLKKNALEVAAVGKIEDIFAGQGITRAVHTVSNADGMEKTAMYMDEVESGLIFTNLVEFDSLFGHRNNALGYGEALREFDHQLPLIIEKLRPNDILMISADHGCDPTTESTDHSREYVPLLVYSPGMKAVNLGIRGTYSDVAATIADYFSLTYPCAGVSFLPEITK